MRTSRVDQTQAPGCDSCTAPRKTRQRYERYLVDLVWWKEEVRQIHLDAREEMEREARILLNRMDCEDGMKRTQMWMDGSTMPAQRLAMEPCILLWGASSNAKLL